MVAVVTGHRGFLGGYASAALEAAEWTVVGAGRPEMTIPSAAFDALLEDVRPRLVVHCAGPASVPASVADPDADRRGAVEVTQALVDRLARLEPPPRLLLVSSAAVYGEPQRLPVDERTPPAPISPYGRHRHECERLVRGGGIPVAIARVFSAYGEGLRRQVLWDIARQALVRDRVDLLGTGAETRDFVHGADVGRALAAVASAAAFEGEAYNVASGVETSIRELAELLLDAFGVHAEIEFSGAGRRGDPTRWLADIGAIRALGFEPCLPLREGVARYAAWLRAAMP